MAGQFIGKQIMKEVCVCLCVCGGGSIDLLCHSICTFTFTVCMYCTCKSYVSLGNIISLIMYY